MRFAARTRAGRPSRDRLLCGHVQRQNGAMVDLKMRRMLDGQVEAPSFDGPYPIDVRATVSLAEGMALVRRAGAQRLSSPPIQQRCASLTGRRLGAMSSGACDAFISFRVLRR